MKILAISGSSSSRSIHTTLLQAVAALTDTDIEIVSVRDFPAPIFSTDIERETGVPQPMIELHRKIQAADGVILAAPEHNGSMTAILKNTIDWLSRVERGQKFLARPVLLLSTSPGGNGGGTNLANMETLAPWWGAEVVGRYSLGRFFDAFTDGQLTDATHRQALSERLRALENRISGALQVA